MNKKWKSYFFGTPDFHNLRPLRNYKGPLERNLGVILDRTLNFGKLIDSMVKPSFFQLHVLAKDETISLF